MDRAAIFNKFIISFPDLNVKYMNKYIDFCLMKNESNLGDNQDKQKHHILPKSHFPEYTNLNKNVFNKCMLSYREHTFAHALLYRAIKTPEMYFAYSLMKSVPIFRPRPMGLYFDENGNKHLCFFDEPIPETYIHSNRGKCVVKDPNTGKYIQVSVNDPRAKEYESINLGFSATYLDPETNTVIRIETKKAKELGLRNLFAETKIVFDPVENRCKRVHVSDNTWDSHNKGYAWYINEITGKCERHLVNEAKRLGLRGIASGKATFCNTDTGENIFMDVDDARKLGYESIFVGTKVVRDPKTGECKRISIDDPNANQYESISKGKKVVLDPNTGKYIQVSVDDPRANEYESLSKGNMKNKSVFVNLKTGENETLDITDKSIDLTEYRHINKNKVNVRDADGNSFQVERDDPRFLSGELVHATTGSRYTREKVQCPHCGKIGATNLMKRYHFNNCKMKEEEITSALSEQTSPLLAFL